MRNVEILPPNLPVPWDDGAAKHLTGAVLPELRLESTSGILELHEIFKNPSVLFIYPRAGSPLEPNTNPELWDATPGARGCTPQSCGFRDYYKEFKAQGIQVFGLSIQSPHVQTEFALRNRLPFPILSDYKYELTDSLNLPTFIFEGERLIRRMVLYVENVSIRKIFYPVFPPDRSAADVLAWLRDHSRQRISQ
ncbi:MAG: peroxiredoxin [Bdellovibrionota bacterium]